MILLSFIRPTYYHIKIYHRLCISHMYKPEQNTCLHVPAVLLQYIWFTSRYINSDKISLNKIMKTKRICKVILNALQINSFYLYNSS